MSNRLRSSAPLEVRYLYRVRNLGRVEDRAARTFQAVPTRGNLDAYDRAIRHVRRARRMRTAATRCAIANARHRLSLLELRHGVNAYALRESAHALRQLGIYDDATHREVTTSRIEPTATPRPLSDLCTVHDRGPNAPPTSFVTTTNNGGSPP